MFEGIKTYEAKEDVVVVLMRLSFGLTLSSLKSSRKRFAAILVKNLGPACLDIIVGVRKGCSEVASLDE